MDIPFAARALAWHAHRAGRIRPVEPLSVLDIREIRRVMLVLTTGIGDAIFSSAVFESVRAALPHARIALFCRSSWQELFSAHPDIDVILPYHGKFRAFFQTIRALREFAPELTLILHGNDPDIIPLCHLAGSRFIVRIPTTGTAFPELLSNRDRQSDHTTLPGLHYVDNRLRILDSIGIPVCSRAPKIVLEPRLLADVQARLDSRLAGCPYWVLHVHAADPYKSLPPDLAATVVTQGLKLFPGHGIVLTGGAENRAALMSLVPEGSEMRVWVAAGELSLAESGACLAGASAIVAPDTGVLHLGAALNRPVIGLYAPTRSHLVGPRAPGGRVDVLEKPLTCDPCHQKKCPHRPVRCMSQFSAEEIMARLSERMAS